MADGINLRTRPTLNGGDDVQSLRRAVDQWGRQLPFGDVGFEFYKATTTTMIAAGNTMIPFDTTLKNGTKVLNSEGFTFSGANLAIPKGKSGVYALEFMAYIPTYTAGATIYVYITNITTGISIAQQALPAGLDRLTVYGQTRLNDGAVISCGIANSGAAGTIGTFAGDTATPPVPHFKGVRVALL